MKLDCNKIRQKASEVIISCDVKRFPLDCFKILSCYGYKIYPYSRIKKENPELYQMCIRYSEDAFHIGSKRLIAYNDAKPRGRIRFSLMHELGHHILEHRHDIPSNEWEADYFANNLLAPRIVLYYARLKRIREISDLFEMSVSAAYYAAQDFSEWCREVCIYGMHPYDRSLYRQLYDPAYGGLVYSVKKCDYCGALLYNSKVSYCEPACHIPDIPESSCSLTPLREEDRKIVTALENRWLYN